MEAEVRFQLELSAAIEEFKLHIQEFKRAFSRRVFGDESRSSLMTIESIVEGSTVVRGAVQAESSSQQQTILAQLSEDLNSNSRILGFLVLSVQYEQTTAGTTEALIESEEVSG